MGLILYKSPAPDEMYPRPLGEARVEVAATVTIFKSFLPTGEVLEDWRTADVVSLVKKGRREKPTNYRSVSPTSAVRKLFEKNLRVRINLCLGR